MRFVLASLLLLIAAVRGGAAQTADCRVDPSSGPTLPLALDLAGRPGVPAGTTGQAYVGVPTNPPGVACRDARPPPSDILRGEPGNTLGPPTRDLLRGPGTPRVWIETR
jgi:hypothetical protein